MVCLKKILFVLLLFIFSLKPAMSLTEGGGVMNGTVSSASNVIYNIITDQTSYCPTDIVNITNYLDNRGNLAATGNLTNTILNPYLSYFKNGTWLNIDVDPGTTTNRTFNHTVSTLDIAGIYTINGQYIQSGEIKNDTETFRIKQGYGIVASSPSFIERTVFPDDTIVQNIYFWLQYPCYGVSINLNTTGGAPGNWTNFTNNPVYLSPDSWNITEVYIYIDLPWDTVPGDYTGAIYASVGQEVKVVVPLTIHVAVQGIFDIDTQVLNTNKEVCIGDYVTGRTSVTKIFPPEELDINLTYRLQQGATIYDEYEETLPITNQIQREINLLLPSYLSEGNYTFYSILNASGSNWTSSEVSYDTFTAVDCGVVTTTTPSGGGGGGVSIGEYQPDLILEVSTNKLLALTGNTTSFLATVENTGNNIAKDVSLAITGIPEDWIMVYPETEDISPGESEEFLILIKVPVGTREAIYEISVQATNGEESNIEKIDMYLASDDKRLIDLLLEDLARIREIANRTLGMECLDIFEIKSLFAQGEMLRDFAFDELREEDYMKAQVFLTQAISTYENVVLKVDVLMDVKMSRTKPVVFFPFGKNTATSMFLLREVVSDDDYGQFCPVLGQVTRYSVYTVSFMSVIFLIVVGLLLLGWKMYKKKKEDQVEARLERIKDRLRDTAEETSRASG